MSKRVNIPATIREQLDLGATVAISISGGKDSQVLLKGTIQAIRSAGYLNHIFAIHADLGRVEWPQTMSHCQKLAQECGVELVTVQRTKGDLLQRWQERMDQLKGTGTPFWSSSASRYCTSDMKRDPINKYLRKFDRIISVEGIRAQESDARAKKPEVAIRKRITTQTRVAYTWNAILSWTEDDVWAYEDLSQEDLQAARLIYQATGQIPSWWTFHPAYVLGNERLSCALCVLACNSDLKNGIRHNPELADTLIGMEQESGCTFKQGKSLEELREQVIQEQEAQAA